MNMQDPEFTYDERAALRAAAEAAIKQTELKRRKHNNARFYLLHHNVSFNDTQMDTIAERITNTINDLKSAIVKL
jgi:hypothetical protein